MAFRSSLSSAFQGSATSLLTGLRPESGQKRAECTETSWYLTTISTTTIAKELQRSTKGRSDGEVLTARIPRHEFLYQVTGRVTQLQHLETHESHADGGPRSNIKA